MCVFILFLSTKTTETINKCVFEESRISKHTFINGLTCIFHKKTSKHTFINGLTCIFDEKEQELHIY